MIWRRSIVQLDRDCLVGTCELHDKFTKEARRQRADEPDAQASSRTVASASRGFYGIIEIAK